MGYFRGTRAAQICSKIAILATFTDIRRGNLIFTNISSIEIDFSLPPSLFSALFFSICLRKHPLAAAKRNYPRRRLRSTFHDGQQSINSQKKPFSFKSADAWRPTSTGHERSTTTASAEESPNSWSPLSFCCFWRVDELVTDSRKGRRTNGVASLGDWPDCGNTKPGNAAWKKLFQWKFNLN